MPTPEPISDEHVRLAVYTKFAREGAAPADGEIAAQLEITEADVRAALVRLARARHVALDPGGAVAMAHPFSAVPLGFAVMGGRTLWWGGCAWDSFAIPHVVEDEPEVLVSTRCPGCGAALAWVVGRGGPPDGDEVAHFLVPMVRVWDDVVRACGHQQLFCSSGCVDEWLARTGNERGYVMDLATLWRLAEHWYEGRPTAGYRRRDPSEAGDYFRSVGLRGPFWGLD